MMLYDLYSPEEVPDAPTCRDCQAVRWRGATWYEPCDEHIPKESHD
ncbi:MAG: hypothetical protein ACYCPT_13745 [Acidimicrobiales bacterium]